MNSKRNVLFALLAAVALTASGCGGFSGGGSVSPATFLLPGIGHHPPKSEQKDPVAPLENSRPLAVSAVVAQ